MHRTVSQTEKEFVIMNQERLGSFNMNGFRSARDKQSV